MQSTEIRKRFLEFFKKREHEIIPSASLVPENDPTVLFNTAGMQPLVPYLLGEDHPQGKRLANSQKCVRTQDIEEVGDKTHDTFFEMLGNWSLGDYFKKEAIAWSYEFLTSKEEGLGLDPERLYVTCFAGDDDAPRDDESAEVWKSLGVPENRIYYFGKEDNWWSPGDNGPCGPDTEMFYDVVGGLNITTPAAFKEVDEKQEVIEVWNDVFMEYEKKDGKVIGKLTQKNVDTGAGLERLTMVLQGKDDIFETDLFDYLMDHFSFVKELRARRIVVDHLRTAIFIIADGIIPGKQDREYVLRRLLRRMFIHVRLNSEDDAKNIFSGAIEKVIDKYKEPYPSVSDVQKITSVILEEQEKFEVNLNAGLKRFNEFSGSISAKDAFTLFATYGFPFEMILELAKEKGITVDEEGFKKEMEGHQEVSKQGSEKKFKGGLADHSTETIWGHTGTHLLQAGLRKVLGDHVLQKGSNITQDRLRFDFNHTEKMTPEQKQEVEDFVNDAIERDLEMKREVMTVDEAKATNTIGLFDDTYAQIGDKISVYSAVDPKNGEIVSREICGGPHVPDTSEMGHFKIKKEESIGSGIRRIKAIVSPK